VVRANHGHTTNWRGWGRNTVTRKLCFWWQMDASLSSPLLSSLSVPLFFRPLVDYACMDQAYNKQFLYLHQGKQLMEKVAGVAFFLRQLVLGWVSFRLGQEHVDARTVSLCVGVV
jgi:hypothetical protein